MTQGQASRQVLRRAALRARRLQRSIERLIRRRRLSLSKLALTVGWMMASPALLANPVGGRVVDGQVQFDARTPDRLNLLQSTERAIVDWQSFGIGTGESVIFRQPSARSVMLNRVLGNDPSAIFGQLSANGTVMLVNPNGIVFGPTARVDVGGLVATTANIRDDDFMAGRLSFHDASRRSNAVVENQGRISIRDSGLAALVAPRVRNSGVIEARLGRIALAAAHQVTLDFHGDGLLSFSAGAALDEAQARGAGPLVQNTGELRADGGSVLLTAQAVKGVVDEVIHTGGIVAATSVSGQGGRIVLSGGEAGRVTIAGRLDTSSSTGTGGSIVATGEHIRVSGAARLDASGAGGGGEIALGSTGFTAAGVPFAHRARSVDVAAGAQLRADATAQGDGGAVTLWSTERTAFAGKLSARGGEHGGHGGFAEISSQKDIALTGRVRLDAPRGKSGTLLIDPTDLRITDTATGGSQDGNATDTSVAAGDADQGTGATLNTVSRGLLESLSGTASIVLQATGQITVDAMAGGSIDLATTAGHGFTLQSTQTGGIRFADPSTQIRTQGGDITLEARGPGSSLSHIGRLSSNGGAITLLATGDLSLAGAIDAGAGALRLEATAGSIANAAGATPLLRGGSVTLTATGGHVGAPGSAIHTATGNLTLSTGGHLLASSSDALASLSITAAHLMPTDANVYQVTAPGLSFQVNDGAAVAVDRIAQTSGLSLNLAADRSLQLGTVDVGSGSLTLRSTAGNLLGAADTALTAASMTLAAQGSNGNNGAVGTAGQSLITTTGHLDASAGSGGVYLSNTGALALDRLSTTGSSAVTATGTLTAADVSAGSATLALGSSGGSLLDDGNATTRITAGTLNLSAGGAIGSSGTRLSTNASTISATAVAGGIHASTSATSSVLSSIVSGDGAIDIRTGGSTTLTSLTSSTSSASNGITVTATGTGSMSVGTINAGALGDVSLATTSGSIFGNSGLITGETVTLNAANSGSVTVRTAASHLDVQAGSSSISITQTGAVTLDRISTPSTVASVTNSSGNITVGSVSTSTSGQVTLTASAGAILDDSDNATRITTGTATLSASGAIGSASHAVQTRATGLTVTSTGDLFVTNTDATLTSLSITNRHSAPGNAGSLQVDSPYLTFNVTDTGTSYTLDQLVSVPLGSLAFNGDATLQIGQVQAAGSVSLTATQGHLVDDGNLNTRVTSGSTLTLSAAQGSVGSSSNPIGAHASALTATTRGDLYVTDITDLSTLTVTSSHPDTSTSYGMAITAPSLKFSVTDSAAGHAVHTLTDNSSLTLNFTSDRDITLGRVDLTSTGTARFTSSAGVIKDDGDKSTRVLANSTTLSGRAVGATGTDHLDVVTGTLAATASAGGVYVELPMPTGSTNTTSTVTLGTVTATGPVAITAREGDLSLGGFITATHQPVTLTAAQGAILSPIGYGISIGTGSLTLDAARAIGSSGAALPVTSSAGATLTAQAGTSMWLSGSGPMSLSSLEATTGITYTQSSGAITVGHVDATAGGTVSITATTGAIQNDSNPATGIRANQVTLSAAQSSVGSGTALTVDTPKLLVTANGAIAVTDSATLDTLSLTRGSGSSGSLAISGVSGQSFTLSEDATDHYVQAVASSTPLAFSFSGARGVRIGHVDVGSAGSATISSAASLTNDGVPGSRIAAGTVSLTAGSAGSIGAAGSGNAMALEGSTALTLSTGRNAFVASDAALTELTITSTNSTTAAGTASVFDVSGLGQTFGITDSGTTQSLAFSGTALTHASFTTRKNIAVGAITATGDVTLATSGGGANSNISSDSGSGTIAGNRVLLSATSSTAGGGSIGSSGTALRVNTPTLILSGSGNVYVNDAQNLARLDMTLTHGTNTTFGYGVTAGNLNSFTVTDGNTQSLGLAVSGAMDFSYSVDRALSLATIDAGTSSTGSIALTSRSAPSGTGAQINRSSGSLTGGRITLSATGTNGGVGAGATLSTNTQNLSIASGGNVSVSNSTTLSSLSLDAQHRTSGSSTHSYAISATGLSFSVSDSLGTNAFQLTSISQSGLDLSVKADRVITAGSVNTGAGGKVTLTSNSYVQGGSSANAGSPSITTGDLSLNGGSAFGYQGSVPLYTAAGTLASSLTNTLYLSNAGALTLKTNTVGSSADVASSNNSLLQDSGGLFTTPTLKLSANQSLGPTGSLLTDARQLTLVARGNVDVSNASDLYALTMTSTHATAGVQNTLSVAAPRLALSLTDSVGGNQYHLSNLVDSSGLDFTFSTDVALSLGTVNVQAGRALALYSTGATTSISNDGSSLLTGGSVLLSAGGSIGAAGGSGTRMQTDALALTLATGAHAYADNAQDLTSLSLTSSQTAGGTAPVYQVTAPSLSFDITDDGSTHINHVADSTGLNFVLNTQRDQAVDRIDVGRSGSVSLTSTGDILGDADSSHRLSAASATFTASNGGAIGSVGNPIRLSAPLASFSPTGALNVESDTHIDRLGISTTHPTVTYGGAYSIVSVPITGAAYPLFSATDSVTGTALTSLDDPLGLAFSFTSDRAMQVGTLNLGSTGTVALTGTSSGGILGDGDPNTLVRAASLSMTSQGGAVGATGSGNGIDATVNTVSAAAQGGGVNLSLHGRTVLGSISATGGVNLANDEGDIALGAIHAGGQAVSINNQGGSILSGSIVDTTTVSLTASGSIGNTSAISTSGNGGGTTTLTASASAAHGASGSIAINESYDLLASSVTAPAAVTLSSGYGLLAGTITSGGAVDLSSSQGSINGSSGSNAITGTRVSLSARYGTGNGIGSSGTRLNVNTPQLVLNTPGSVYVTDSADLNLLTLDRTNYMGGGSSGTLSVMASGLTFSATDSSNTTTLTSLADGTGLDFNYLGIGSLSVGSLNVGNTGSMLLQAYLSSGNGNIDAIDNSSLITAGSLTLQAYGTGSNIGSSGTALGLAVGGLTASSGTGGMVLRQAGSLSLSSLSTTGDLAVTASSGDLTLGTLSYGSAKTLSLTASGGSILAGSGTLAGSGASAAITLSAANGIGTAAAPLGINASAGHTLNASVTGTGSLHLASLGTLNGGLSTAVHNGATSVTAAGNIKLTSMNSATDAAGNDIRVTASAGDITAVSVSGGSGAQFNAVTLRANAGRLLTTAGATLEGAEVTLHGATGVGSSGTRVSARAERVQVSSGGGAIYLSAATPAVLTSVQSNGGAIDIVHSADLLLANAVSSGGAITVNSSTANADLIAGNLNAGSGTVTLSSTGMGGTLADDGNLGTRVIGGTVSLTGTAGVGTASRALQTSANTLSASSGNGIVIEDGRTAGVSLASVVATGGAVSVSSAGPTLATLVQASADSAGNHVTLSTSSGDLTLVSVSAGANQGAINLSAAGSILASGSGTHVTGQSATLSAGADIGAVTDLATGAGTPVKLDVHAIAGLGSSGSNRVVSVLNTGTTALRLGGGALSLGSGSSAYIDTAGDLDLSAGIALANGNLSLTSGGTLLLPTAAISTTGAVRLIGSTDIVTSGSGAAARELRVNAGSLVLRSGAAGGSTQLTTAVGSIDATLVGAGDLGVTNTGTLGATTLSTADGHISATSSTGLSAGAVNAGGAGRNITLTATAGNLELGTLNAGSGGSMTLSAAQGSLSGASAALTASDLNLAAGNGIGSSATAFDVTAAHLSAQVTGTGGIHVTSGQALSLGNVSTHDGDIRISAAGDLTANALSAGHSGDVSLSSTGGRVILNQAYTQTGTDTSRAGLSLQGTSLQVGAVSTTGAQRYTGALNLAGDLVAASIRVDGGLTLSGGPRTLTGDLHITGALDGGGQAATLNGGSGAVVLEGAASGLASLNATAASLQLSGVATTGAQTYQGATILNGSYTTQGGAFQVIGATQLAGATSLSTGGGAATFAGTVDGAAALGVDTGAGAVTLGAAVGATQALTSLSVGGPVNIGGNVVTSGSQTYGGAATLAAHASLQGDRIGFVGTLDGARDLTVSTGAAGFALTSAVGSQTRLGSLTVISSGVTRLGAAVRAASVTTDAAGSLVLDGGLVDTTGAQTYGERATLGADTTLRAGTVTLSAGAEAATAGGQSLDIQGHAALGGALGASQALGSLSVSGTTSLAGQVVTTGTQRYHGATTLAGHASVHGDGVEFGSTLDGARDLTIQAGAQGVSLGGAVGAVTRLGALAIDSSGTTRLGASVRAASLSTGSAGALALDGGSVDTTGTQAYGARAVLGADTVLAASQVTLAAGADALAAGAQSLSIQGPAVTAGALGAHQALRSLSIGGSAALGGDVTTTGEQRYQGATTLNGSYTTQGGAFGVDGAAQLAGATRVSTGGGAVTFGSTVDGAAALTVGDGAGATTLAGPVGATQALASLSVGGRVSLGGAVTTTGAQAYAGAATLAGPTTLMGASVSFGSTLDGAHDLTVNTGASGFDIVAAVGDSTRLGALTVNTSGATRLGASVRAASVTTDSAGSLALQGGSVDTTGTQRYGEHAVLGADTTLAGRTITLSAGADGSTAGGQSLVIQGDAVTGGALGATQALRSLSISGETTLGGHVTSAGAQRFGGATTLAVDTVLSGTGVALAGAVDGARHLSVHAGAGDARFGAAVGSQTRLGELSIDSRGDIQLAGSVRAGSVDTGSTGALALNGGSVDTTGTQTYGQRAVLGGDTTLTGSQIALKRGADAAVAGSPGLVIDGDALLDGPVGGQRALGSVAVSGRTALGADVVTRGEQRYRGDVAVNGDLTLHSTAGGLVLGSTLDSASAHAITLRADAGGIAVAGDVGAIAAPGALILRGGTLTTFNGSVRAGQLAQSFGGVTHWVGPVTAQGSGGVRISGSSQRFDGDLTASTGRIDIALTEPAGTLSFAAGSTVQAATGFGQTGGSSVQLPAALTVTAGDITMQAPAYRESGRISLATQGDITLAGLTALQSIVRISSGSGMLAVGQNPGSDSHRLAVARLEVPAAGSAEVFGTVRGLGGAFAASLVDSALVGPPYYLNATPWGPIDAIATVTALTVPIHVVPSTPRARALFTGGFTGEGLAPQALTQYLSPQVLTIGPLPTVLSVPSPAAAGSGPAAQRPAGAAGSPRAALPTGIDPAGLPSPGQERDDLDRQP